MAALWCLGAYHPDGWGGFRGLAVGLLLAVCSALLEEILFRAYLYRILAMVSGTWISVLLTSALFGAAHAGNRGATLLSSIAIALEAGVLLSGAYAATGRLWAPIGLHFGWNFAESSLFGMSVSGLPETSALSRGTLSGPALLTGGAFGPEASIAAVCLCLVPGIIFLWYAAHKGRAQPPVWKPQ
jgi:membrane protease YdiL (CAAX protease family)